MNILIDDFAYDSSFYEHANYKTYIHKLERHGDVYEQRNTQRHWFHILMMEVLISHIDYGSVDFTEALISIPNFNPMPFSDKT